VALSNGVGRLVDCDVRHESPHNRGPLGGRHPEGVLLEIAVAFLVGCALGFGVRSAVSKYRRAQVRRNRIEKYGF
jgi:hypothetical protein